MLAKAIRWALGDGLQCSKDGETGISETITLIGILLAIAVTFLAALHGDQVIKTIHLCLYVAGSLLPLVAIVGIIRATKPKEGEDEKMFHFYNDATIRYSRWAAGFCALLIASLAGLVLAKALPVRDSKPVPRPLTPSAAILGTWDYDDHAKLIVRYAIDEKSYPEGIPDRLDLSVTVKKSLRDAWEIWSLDLLEKTPDEDEPELVTSVQLHVDAATPFACREYFADFRKPGKSYLVEIWLHAFKGPDKEAPTCAKENEAQARAKDKDMVMEGKGLSVADNPKPKSSP